MIKAQVKVKGEIFISIKNRTFKNGSTISLSTEELKDSYVQTMIKKGFLIFEEGDENLIRNKEEVIKIRSLKNNTIVIPSINRSIGPKEEIYIAQELIYDNYIQQAISSNFIEIVEENIEDKKKVIEEASEQVTEGKKEDKKEIVEEKSEDKKEKSNRSKIKRIKSSKEEKDSSNKAEKNDKPYVHRPEGARINEPPTVLENGLDEDIFIDLGKEEKEISFVDEEQKAEKVKNRRRIAENNEEIS